MKRTLISCLLGLVSLLSVAWSQHSKTSGGTEQAVTVLEQQWLQAQKTSNPDLLAPLLADNYVETASDGKVTDKAETLAATKSTKWDTAKYSDLKVSIFGDTAIARGGFKGKGTDPSGKALEIYERFTDTWVKMPSGKWQCVAGHGSLVKM
jgi:ketosteroid isomerase-like protein